MDQFRQGDVLLIRVSHTKVDKKKRIKARNGKLILAEGEATGHHHSIPSSAGKMYALATGMALMIQRATTLTHQEHSAIDLPPGEYFVTTQRQMNTDQMLVPVRD